MPLLLVGEKPVFQAPQDSFVICDGLVPAFPFPFPTSGTQLHFVKDRKTHRERWVQALQQAMRPGSRFAVCFINGPADPLSGGQMLEQWKKIVSADRRFHVRLPDHIGHWPLQEDEPGTLEAIKHCLRDM